MTTLADTQDFLRQKRAIGRLSPDEMESAYKAYYSSEAGQALNRQELQLRTEQEDRRLALQQNQIDIQERQYRDNRAAEKIQGRLQIAKVAVPDLFMYKGGDGGGAQTSTTSAIGGGDSGTTNATPAVESLSQTVSSYSDTSNAAPSVFGDLAEDAKTGFGQSWGDRAKDIGKGGVATTLLGVGPGPGFAAAAINEFGQIVVNIIGTVFDSIFGSFFGEGDDPMPVEYGGTAEFNDFGYAGDGETGSMSDSDMGDSYGGGTDSSGEYVGF